MYTQAMRDAAQECNIAFADVFAPTKKLFQTDDRRYTFNGCHLNSEGYGEFGKILNDALFGKSEASKFYYPLK